MVVAASCSGGGQGQQGQGRWMEPNTGQAWKKTCWSLQKDFRLGGRRFTFQQDDEGSCTDCRQAAGVAEEGGGETWSRPGAVAAPLSNIPNTVALKSKGQFVNKTAII